jgi:hypothetical protein
MEDRLKQIRERAEKAASGPWEPECWNDWQDESNPVPLLHLKSPYIFATADDFEFIAHAREDIPWLLEQLQVAIEALRAIKAHSDCRVYPEEWIGELAKKALTEIAPERE